MEAHQVRVLLMGGQACVFYGAAEFSRDIDFTLLGDAENLEDKLYWQPLRAGLERLHHSK